MLIERIHSGPYSDEAEEDWWLVVKTLDVDYKTRDIEVHFNSLEEALWFEDKVVLSWAPVEVELENGRVV